MPAPPLDDSTVSRGWFASYGWLLLILLALAVGGPAGRALFLLHAKRQAVIGDGKNVATYGFDLSPLLVPADLLVAGGMPRDYLPVLNEPRTFTPAQVAALNEELARLHKGRFLLDNDLVIGVAIGGEARAYPIGILNWHEVVNDQLGGVPIAVTYSGLCDSAVVFDRRVGNDTLQFGLSGLLFNSNLVLYDVRSDGASSLWSQLQARAIAGPATSAGTSKDGGSPRIAACPTKEGGTRLTVIPAELTTYRHWLADHPNTTVLRGEPEYGLERYGTSPYEPYYVTGSLKFPVRLFPPPDAPPLPSQGPPDSGRDEGAGSSSPHPPNTAIALGTMSPILAVKTTGEWKVLPLAQIAANAGSDGQHRLDVDGTAVQFQFDQQTHTATARSLDPQHPAAVIYARWFAWHAMYQADGSLRLETEGRWQ